MGRTMSRVETPDSARRLSWLAPAIGLALVVASAANSDVPGKVGIANHICAYGDWVVDPAIYADMALRYRYVHSLN